MSPSDQMELFISKEESEQDSFFNDMKDHFQTTLINQLSIAIGQNDPRIDRWLIRFLKERQARIRAGSNVPSKLPDKP